MELNYVLANYVAKCEHTEETRRPVRNMKLLFHTRYRPTCTEYEAAVSCSVQAAGLYQRPAPRRSRINSGGGTESGPLIAICLFLLLLGWWEHAKQCISRPAILTTRASLDKTKRADRALFMVDAAMNYWERFSRIKMKTACIECPAVPFKIRRPWPLHRQMMFCVFLLLFVLSFEQSAAG